MTPSHFLIWRFCCLPLDCVGVGLSDIRIQVPGFDTSFHIAISSWTSSTTLPLELRMLAYIKSDSPRQSKATFPSRWLWNYNLMACLPSQKNCTFTLVMYCRHVTVIVDNYRYYSIPKCWWVCMSVNKLKSADEYKLWNDYTQNLTNVSMSSHPHQNHSLHQMMQPVY